MTMFQKKSNDDIYISSNKTLITNKNKIESVFTCDILNFHNEMIEFGAIVPPKLTNKCKTVSFKTQSDCVDVWIGFTLSPVMLQYIDSVCASIVVTNQQYQKYDLVKKWTTDEIPKDGKFFMVSPVQGVIILANNVDLSVKIDYKHELPQFGLPFATIDFVSLSPRVRTSYMKRVAKLEDGEISNQRIVNIYRVR